MKRIFIFLSVMLLTVAVNTAASQSKSSTSRAIDVESPVKMHIFLPEASQATGRAVVDLPGGGYSILATEHEGTEWSEFFNSRGIALIVVEYKMPNGDRTIPINDAEGAIKYVREHAAEFNIRINDIGIMGFSAGGHLASTVATHATGSAIPNFQILFYPVISMDKELTHIESHNALLGADASSDLEAEFSSDKKVNATTPQAFIAVSGDDTCVKPMNSLNYYTALLKAGVPATLHVYATGEHGWGYHTTFKYHDLMLSELSEWLKSF